jgi:RNA polymerase sigma-70 factor (ECF subfamily)
MIWWKFLPEAFAWAAAQAVLRLKDDSGLARRLRERDRHAMASLYKRYGKPAYSLIFYMVRNAAVAEDLVEETFLRVWNRAQSFDPQRGALGPWILAVARNRAIDHLRAASGRLAAGTPVSDSIENPALFSAFEEDALSADRARRLTQAFEKLSPQQRTVIGLAYYEGLSETEMAERMQQPLGAVKTWLRTALTLLRQELAGSVVA